MTLESTIEKAIDLTGRLEAALKVGDMDLCRDLIEIRGEIFYDFELTHRESSEAERKRCQTILAKLKSGNDQLQVKWKESMVTTAGDLRRAINSGASTPIGAYKSQSSPGCLDRKV